MLENTPTILSGIMASLVAAITAYPAKRRSIEEHRKWHGRQSRHAGEIRLSRMKREDWGNVAYGGDVDPPRNQEGGSGNPPHLIEKHACHGALPFCRDPENNRQNIGYWQQANLPIYLPISQYQANSPKNQWLGQ